MMDIVEVTPIANFAFTCSALLFSISCAIDTFAKRDRKEEFVRTVIDTLAIAVAVILPNLKDEQFLAAIMNYFDSNILLLLALFFTMASQWAAEIKQKDMKKQQR